MLKAKNQKNRKRVLTQPSEESLELRKQFLKVSGYFSVYEIWQIFLTDILKIKITHEVTFLQMWP